MLDPETIEKNKGKFLGSGCARSVYEFTPKTVIKEGDEWSNRYEYEKYMQLHEEDHPYLRFFFAVIDVSEKFDFLEMEKAAEILTNRFETYELALDWLESDDPVAVEIHKIAEELGIEDVHDENIGFREDGSWGFIDYETYE